MLLTSTILCQVHLMPHRLSLQIMQHRENKNALAAALYENEGGKVVGAWNCAVDSLQSYAKFAAELAQKIKRGNVELDIILVSAEKELKIFYESEDTRWKYLCDAAKGETKAKVRRKQNVADLEKAKTKVTLAEGEGSSENADETQTTKSSQSVNKSLGKMFAMMPGASEDTPANKMAPSVNKAMGKMFSMMPGGGEDVMAKVLKPEQRLAIAKRNLDEAKAKELKATESFDVATSVKQQAITSYVTEAEAAEYKFKSDDRYAWNEMQKSLQCSIGAMGIFRECHQESLSILIKGIAGYMLTAMPDDITQWTTTTEKLIKKYRTRRASEMKEKSNEFETGFSLGLHLEDSTDVKELVSLVIADEDGITIEEEELDQSTKDDEGIENKTTPLPDVPPDAVMAKME